MILLDSGAWPRREGLCADRTDHAPHEHLSATLGAFWCHAVQARREPFATQRLLDARRG